MTMEEVTALWRLLEKYRENYCVPGSHLSIDVMTIQADLLRVATREIKPA